MSFFHHSRTSKSPISRKLSRKQPPSSEGIDESSNGHNGPDSNESSIAPSSPIGDEEGRKTLDSFPLPQRQQEVQQQQPASFRKNDNFMPKQVAEGTGAFANGEAQHEISSKKDYELCKEQVEKGQSRQEVLEHFKLVKDLKPLDAPESMDKEIDNTKNPTK